MSEGPLLSELYEKLTGRPHRIGVFDYQSLCDLIRHEYERLFPGNTTADPQAQVQEMAGAIMDLRVKLEKERCDF